MKKVLKKASEGQKEPKTKRQLNAQKVADDNVQPAEGAPAKVDPRNKLNALTAREWIPETVTVWTQRGLGAGHPDAQIERQHPAPFSFTDVSRLIKLFPSLVTSSSIHSMELVPRLKLVRLREGPAWGLSLTPSM